MLVADLRELRNRRSGGAIVLVLRGFQGAAQAKLAPKFLALANYTGWQWIGGNGVLYWYMRGCFGWRTLNDRMSVMTAVWIISFSLRSGRGMHAQNFLAVWDEL